MGLDMHMFKITRLSIKERNEIVGLRAEELDARGFYVVPKESVDKYPELYGKVVDWFTPTKATHLVVDMEKLRKENGISDDADVVCRSILGTEIKMTFANDDDSFRKELSFKTPDFERDYVVDSEDDFYVWKQEEVGYWRKDYSLQSEIHELLGGNVENTGYYPLTKTQLKKIERFSGKKFPHPLDSGEVVVYWEWY